MSFDNVEAVRHIYGAWEKEGSPVASGICLDPDIEWVNPPDAVELRHSARPRFLRDCGELVADKSFEGVAVDIDEVARRRRSRRRPRHPARPRRGSGADVERRQGYIWTLRDGKATRFEWFNTPDEALRAAGLHC